MEENWIFFFAICTWPNSPVRAKNLSRFQFDGKNDDWISQVRRVNKDISKRLSVGSACKKTINYKDFSTAIFFTLFEYKISLYPKK